MRLMPRSFVAVVACAILAACASPNTGERKSVIGYNTVDEARSALLMKPTAKSTEEQGWLIVKDSADNTLWLFAPVGHEAYPAVIKRTVTQDKDGIYVRMTALCQAEKAPCDRLFAQFQRLNENVRREIQRRLEKKELEI